MAAIERLSRTYRHLGRYRKILSVLVRHGFGGILERLSLDRYLDSGLGTFGESSEAAHPKSDAERLRLALVDLGPTFIKLGQLLSTRPDLIPADLAQELEQLQDQAPPFGGDEAQRIVEEELGGPLDNVFSSFEHEPFAAASLGQVHRAVLAEGGLEVVVKVQRPDIRKSVETDLEILEHLTSIAERHAPTEEWGLQQPAAIAAEFRKAVDKELDYTIEAAHLRRFALMFRDDDTVKIPAVFPRFTTSKVLTMELLAGIKVSRLDGSEGDHDRERVARRGADAMLRQIFEFGFFHADPHPGNILVLPGDVVGLIDLGQIGRIDRERRLQVARLFGSLIGDDVEAAAEALIALSHSEVEPELHALEADVAELIDWHLGRPVGEIQIARMVWHLMEIATRHHRSLAPDIFLVLKALATADALVRELDPGFDLPSHSRPLLRRLALEPYAPWNLASGAWETTRQLTRLLRDLPSVIREVLSQIDDGRLSLDLEHRNLETAQHTLEQVANRLAFAIVLAALLIASSLVALGDIPPKWHGVPVIGIVGYLLSAVIGLRLLWSIFRRGGL